MIIRYDSSNNKVSLQILGKKAKCTYFSFQHKELRKQILLGAKGTSFELLIMDGHDVTLELLKKC